MMARAENSPPTNSERCWMARASGGGIKSRLLVRAVLISLALPAARIAVPIRAALHPFPDLHGNSGEAMELAVPGARQPESLPDSVGGHGYMRRCTTGLAAGPVQHKAALRRTRWS